MANVDLKLLRTLREEINAALVSMGEKHGVKLHLGNGSCDRMGREGHLKLEIVAVDEDSGEAFDMGKEDFLHYGYKFGFKDDDFGRTFRSNGKEFTICGYNRNAHKTPIIATRTDTGKRYRFDGYTVKALLDARQKQPA